MKSRSYVQIVVRNSNKKVHWIDTVEFILVKSRSPVLIVAEGSKREALWLGIVEFTLMKSRSSVQIENRNSKKLIIWIDNHCRIHSGEKPFACPDCDEKFRETDHMRRAFVPYEHQFNHLWWPPPPPNVKSWRRHCSHRWGVLCSQWSHYDRQCHRWWGWSWGYWHGCERAIWFIGIMHRKWRIFDEKEGYRLVQVVWVWHVLSIIFNEGRNNVLLQQSLNWLVLIVHILTLGRPGGWVTIMGNSSLDVFPCKCFD